MDKILIAYHSLTGATEKMALAAAEGARAAGATVTVKQMADMTIADLETAESVIWGTGNYFQTMSGIFWDYFNHHFYKFLKMETVKNKVYGCVCSAGNGGALCLNPLHNICRDLKWKRAFDPVVAFHQPKPDILEKCTELGRKMALLKKEDAADLNPPKKPRFEWPPRMDVVAAPGEEAAQAKAWGDLLYTTTGKTKVLVASEADIAARLRWVGLRLFLLAGARQDELGRLLRAEGAYATRESGPFAVRLVWVSGTAGQDLLVTHNESYNRLTHRFGRWLNENYEQLKATHPANAGMTVANLTAMVERTWVPVHEGLQRFMNENGLWTTAHEARQKTNVALIDQYLKAYQEVRDEADARGVALLPSSKIWLEIWAHKLQGLPPLKTWSSISEGFTGTVAVARKASGGTHGEDEAEEGGSQYR